MTGSNDRRLNKYMADSIIARADADQLIADGRVRDGRVAVWGAHCARSC